MRLCVVLAPLDPDQPLTAFVPEGLSRAEVRDQLGGRLTRAGWPALARQVLALPLSAFWLAPVTDTDEGDCWVVAPRPDYVLTAGGDEDLAFVADGAWGTE
jgi:hypothetical protein